MPTKYDQTQAEEIERFGALLIGRTLRTQPGEVEIPAEMLESRIDVRSRNAFGNILEKYYFGISPGNDSAPDFPDAGVELKSTALKRLAKGGFSAKERLVLGIINYKKEAEVTKFEESSFLRKNAVIMLVSYENGNRPAVDHPIRIARLMRFDDLPEKDRVIIRNDWNKIARKIRENRAHELSEGDTDYLAACTKAATGANVTVQPDGTQAKPRAFSFKSGYMTVLLRQMLAPDAAEAEFAPAVSLGDLATKTLEEEIISRFEPYIGRSVSEIVAAVGDGLNPDSKDYLAMLARRMIGVRGKKIEEFEKAEISMKTIQVRADGMPKEHMSFPAIRFDQLVEEDWEAPDEGGDRPASTFKSQLQKRFLFVVYRCEDKCEKEESRVLDRAFFWTMPADVMESEVRPVWERMKCAVEKSNEDLFPKKNFNDVAHVRPHGRKGIDVSPLRDGTLVTKRCFWLSKEFIKKVLDS